MKFCESKAGLQLKVFPDGTESRGFVNVQPGSITKVVVHSLTEGHAVDLYFAEDLAMLGLSFEFVFTSDP